MTACPTCNGESMPDHPAGQLAWHHTNDCTLRDLEDARQAADHAALRHVRRFLRPATDTEALLLTALGLTVPSGLQTYVSEVSPAVHRRSWPPLTPIGS